MAINYNTYFRALISTDIMSIRDRIAKRETIGNTAHNLDNVSKAFYDYIQDNPDFAAIHKKVRSNAISQMLIEKFGEIKK